jgi:diadenosine tetraphosphate (Ap4A) HIT family hydrolase
MEESIFTKIVKGEIPSHKVYEDALTLAFLDIHPVQPGHTLVIPKKQVEFVWDLPEEDYQAVDRVQGSSTSPRSAWCSLCWRDN